MVNETRRCGERLGMALTGLRGRRVAAAGAFVVAALAVPGLATPADRAVVAATGDCLAWFGSRDDGICIGYSSGNGINAGTPQIGVFGPDYGFGVTTGPLLPGTTIREGISP
jgi:hypothetical protein